MKLAEIAALIEPTNFRQFAIVTKGGLRMDVPHWEFVVIPPSTADGETPGYVIAFTTGKATAPKLIDLDAIDHIDYELKPIDKHGREKK
jgi:hypothetical protein